MQLLDGLQQTEQAHHQAAEEEDGGHRRQRNQRQPLTYAERIQPSNEGDVSLRKATPHTSV